MNAPYCTSQTLDASGNRFGTVLVDLNSVTASTAAYFGQMSMFVEGPYRRFESLATRTITSVYALRTIDPHIVAPSDSSLSKASQWVCGMMFVASALNEIPLKVPMISGNLDGQVVFEWWGANKKLTVRIDEDGIESIRLWGARPDVHWVETELDTEVQQRSAWRWLNSNE